MATNNSVDVGLSGSTGTGNFVGANTPTLITPVIGAATATSVAFSPTTGGIIGTTAADNAGAGKVGEFIQSVIASGSAVNAPNNTAINVTSISLTAGDWDVFGNVTLTPTGSASYGAGWISTTSATLPDSSLYSIIDASAAFGAGGMSVPYKRINISGTTTVYLSAQGNFTTGTMSADGGIYARRVR